MAKGRKDQFGPALTAAFFCLLITGAAVGYVWQKGEINHLGRQLGQREEALRQWQSNNQRLAEECADLQEPKRLEQLVKDLNLGLEPSTVEQRVQIVESALPAGPKMAPRQWVARGNAVVP